MSSPTLSRANPGAEHGAMAPSISVLSVRDSRSSKSPGRGLSRFGWVVVSALMVMVAGCGGRAAPETEQGAAPAVAEWETTTTRGLAAGLVEHVGAPSEGIRGGSNSEQGLMVVSAQFERDGGAVPVDLVVLRSEEGEDSSSEMSCEDQGGWILGCELETAPDGSPVLVLASTEDLTGGISEDGLFVFVINARDDHDVLVIQTLPDRRASYVDFSALPVDVETLKQLVTDPLVGFETSAARNDAGERLRDFSEG
jgi:hypothetical protein